MSPNPYDQHGSAVRFDWGPAGLRQLAPDAAVIVVVDVLSFSTCVDIATARGASVLPYWGGDPAAYAEVYEALVADRRNPPGGGWSLSPASLVGIPPGTRLVLPSPNGSALTAEAASRGAAVLAGSLRNAGAIAAAAGRFGSPVAVIAAGERWAEDGSLRPAVEDLLGAGAIIRAMDGSRSPEAAAAAAAFEQHRGALLSLLRHSASGRELIAGGFAGDVELAAALDVSSTVPLLDDGAFSDRPPP